MASPLAEVDANELAILQTYYNKKSQDLTFTGRPFLGLVPKGTDGGGDSCVWPVTIANIPTSAAYATAFALASNQQRVRFTTNWLEMFDVAQINNTNLALARQKGKTAIIDLMTAEVDGAWKSLANRLESLLMRSGFGDIGVIAAGGISGSVMTLTNRQDTLNFYKGQQVQLAATLSASALRAGGPLTVASVQRSAGTVTFTAGIVATIATAAAGDVVFNNGDRQNSATPVPILPIGLDGYLPLTAPSGGDAVFGASVDRSTDPDYLAGVRVNMVGASITEGIDAGLARLVETDSIPSLCLLSSKNWNQYKQEQSNRSVILIEDVEGSGITISFKAITHMGPRGPVKVVSTGYLGDDRMYLLQEDVWKLISVGELIQNPLHNGRVQDLISADAVLVKNKFLGTLRCEAPGYNAVVQLA